MDSRVVAVIPTHNRKELVIECIRSLLNQSRPLDGIILVDNASTDGTVEAIEERFDHNPIIEIHRLDRNTGASGGFNAATKIALNGGYDWVWFTDDDSEPEPDSLGALLEAASALSSSGSKVAGLASMKIDPRGSIQTLHNGRFTWRQIPISESRCKGIVPIQYAAFTGLLISREAILSAGLVNPDYFIWGDDLEYCLRIGKTGGLYLVSDSRVLHKDILLNPRERFELEKFWRYYFGMRNWVHTARTYRGYWTVPLIFAACTYRILTIWTGMDKKILRTRSILKAFIDGLRGDFSDPITPERWNRMISNR